MALSQARLKSLLDYDQNTGQFVWRKNGRGRFKRIGAIAGTIRKDGHHQICIDGILYATGPLAFMWMIGRWPEHLVAHINGNQSDDAWHNLREATQSQIGAGERTRKSKRYSSLKGVTYDKQHDKYQAMIKVDYKAIWLGRFDTAEEAHAAYCMAAHKYFGEFAS